MRNESERYSDSKNGLLFLNGFSQLLVHAVCCQQHIISAAQGKLKVSFLNSNIVLNFLLCFFFLGNWVFF